MTYFFVALFTFLVLPHLLSSLFRINKLLPMVFLQLVLGWAINASGLATWLQTMQFDLMQGALAAALEGLGWLGVALLIAITGAEALPEQLPDQPPKRTPWHIAIISVTGFAFTCLIGSLVGFALVSRYPELMGAVAQPWIFSIGIGIALAVTALPVLVVIVRQGGFQHHPLARLAIQCAVLDDLWLWLGMAAVLACASSTSASPLWLVAGLLAYVALMFGLVRPALRAWFQRTGGHGDFNGLLVAVAVILMSAALTGMIGLHATFGSFVAGVILPRGILKHWREPMQQLIHTLLLPAFFILTGMRLNVDIHSPLFWTLTAVVTISAIGGKMLAVAISARIVGLPWKTGLGLGSLMQCKGLMELIAINILLDAGIVGGAMFSSLAMMAMASTFITLPMMRWFLKPGSGNEAGPAYAASEAVLPPGLLKEQ